MDDLEFNSKKEASKFVIDLYKKFYKKNQTNRHFSERKFSQKINVSQSSLNSLRNSARKELDPELVVKVLRGIGQPDFIEPVLSEIKDNKQLNYLKRAAIPLDRSGQRFLRSECKESLHVHIYRCGDYRGKFLSRVKFFGTFKKRCNC